MKRDDHYRFEPFRLRRGTQQSIKLVLGAFDGHAKVVATRGRARYFETTLQRDADGDEFVSLDIPPDAIEGYYTLVVTPVDGKPIVIRNAFMVLDPQHHNGRYPMLDEYEKWGYVIADDGIPMKDVSGAVGFVHHPLVVTYFFVVYNQHFNRDPSRKGYRDGVLRLLEWLKSAVSEGPQNSLLVRHSFALESFDLAPGWISGLTQGRVAECFLIGADITGNQEYRQLAARMMEIFHVPVSDGGLLATDKLGHVSIEEYPSEPASWALNGIGSAIASLEKIAHAIQIDWADDLIERVCDSLEAKISLFDAPDYPGSKVQLALKRRLGFSFRPDKISEAVITKAAGKLIRSKPMSDEQQKVNLYEVKFTPPLSDPYTVSLCPNGRDASCGIDLHPAPVWRDSFIDGNIDANNSARSQKTSVGIDIEVDRSGVFALHRKEAEGDMVVFEQRLNAGRHRIETQVDWNDVYRGGVGRIARFDEYYHETNLAWMWCISRYGTKPRLAFAARRWLLSFYLGIGRLPHDGAAVDVTPLEIELRLISKELENFAGDVQSPAIRARKCKVETLEFLLSSLRGELPATCEFAMPCIVMNDDIVRVQVFGHGFKGDERAIPTEDNFSFRACELTKVSGDEVIIECKLPEKIIDLPITARMTIVDAKGASLAGESRIEFDIHAAHTE